MLIRSPIYNFFPLKGLHTAKQCTVQQQRGAWGGKLCGRGALGGDCMGTQGVGGRAVASTYQAQPVIGALASLMTFPYESLWQQCFAFLLVDLGLACSQSYPGLQLIPLKAEAFPASPGDEFEMKALSSPKLCSTISNQEEKPIGSGL
ncbi:Tryptophan 2-monooxygenase [Gossypium arboreum]|uniref:Tryptophan 2-monooxygenase n=1 Tax=Gossypium arboreum TaxID=29729 RepID=A0A0B0PE59_GOSAR|nr:Tryptophan 2-monooxygenase [Gossypium arboreum]